MRLAIGLLFVAAYAVMRWFVPLPFVDAAKFPPPIVSAFALGPMPYISGLLVVEVVAWLAPPLRHLRAGSPGGRAKLDGAALAAGLAFAVLQAYGIVAYLSTLNAFGFPSSKTRVLVTLTLVAGAMATVALARAAAARGVPAPLVPMFALSMLPFRGNTPLAPDGLDLAKCVLAVVVTIGLAATVVLNARRRSADWIPIPAGTIGPPNVLAAFALLGGGAASFASSPVAQLVAIAIAAAVFTAIVHRPAAPTTVLSAVMFVVALLAADLVITETLGWSRIVWIAIVAIVWVADVAAAVRDPDAVVLATTRPREALAAVELLATNKIRATTQGLGTSSLFQVLGPHAVATVRVARDDVETAEEVLAGNVVVKASTSRTLLVPLVGIALASVAVLFVPRVEQASIRRDITLALQPVDEEALPFEQLDESSLPKGALVQTELAPAGVNSGGAVRQVPTRFVRIVLQPHETVRSAAERVAPWLKEVSEKSHVRLALGTVENFDEVTGRSSVVALRTFALRPEVIVTEKDVARVDAAVDQNSGPTPKYYVAVTLRPEGAARFSDATARLVKRRLAIVIDGMVETAPVVQSQIVGGSLSITLGTDASAERAKMLARNLGGR